MATFAPSAARRFAMAAPMPRDPPVISAIFPSSFLVIVFLLLLESRSLLLLRLAASLEVSAPRWQHTLLSWHRCLPGMGGEMELRHLRYFVAIAEAGSMTVAAGRKLHTSQPSLSRQIRDLEEDVGAQLLTRRARGIELTPAGRTFLDHARLVLSQVDAAGEGGRRGPNPSKPGFTMGFLTGHELTWMPEALRILRDELPNINVMISSQYSPPLADAISKGNVDAGFLRRERGVPELAFRLLVKEPIVVVLPSDHPLAARKAISPGDLVGETFVGGSRSACRHRRLLEAVRNQSQASSRDGTRRHGGVLNRVDGRRSAFTRIRPELSHSVRNEPSPPRRCANCRSGPRLQKVEPVSHLEAFAFESG